MQKEARVTLSADLTIDATSFSVNAGANFSTGTVVVQIDTEKNIRHLQPSHNINSLTARGVMIAPTRRHTF